MKDKYAAIISEVESCLVTKNYDQIDDYCKNSCDVSHDFHLFLSDFDCSSAQLLFINHFIDKVWNSLDKPKNFILWWVSGNILHEFVLCELCNISADRLNREINFSEPVLNKCFDSPSMIFIELECLLAFNVFLLIKDDSCFWVIVSNEIYEEIKFKSFLNVWLEWICSEVGIDKVKSRVFFCNFKLWF